MIGNYLVVAWRNLKRFRLTSLINVFGLALSMSVCLLILLFIRDQKRYDHFHARADRIYRVYSDFKSEVNADKHLYAMSPAGLGTWMRQEIPGIEQVVRLNNRFGGRVVQGGQDVELSGLFTEPSFFEVFSFRLAEGNPRTALSAPRSVVLSETTARRFFGDRNPLGQVLQVQEGEAFTEYTVTGVLEDPPFKTHFPADAFASLSTVTTRPDFAERYADWTRSIYGWYTYVLLEKGASPSTVQARLPGLIREHFAPRNENVLHTLLLQNLQDINLGPFLDNQLGMVLPNFFAYVLSLLGVIILVVACFNYVGISLARALQRAREVGVRKMIGATRRQVVGQFLIETFLTVLLALVVSCGLLVWLVPSFNALWFVSFSETQISLNLWKDPGVYLLFLGFAALVAVVAGLNPALILSRFQAGRAIRLAHGSEGRMRARSRKSFIAVQFVLALLLAVTTTTVYRQSVFLLEADYRFDRENLLNVELQDVPYDVFRAQAMAVEGVRNVSAVSILPATGSRRDIWLRTPGREEPVKAYNYSVDEHFLANLGLRLLAGRNFSPSMATDRERVILNEQALRALGLGTPAEAVGQVVLLEDSTRMEVAGVVADFQSNALSEVDTPVTITYGLDGLAWANVRVEPGAGRRVAAALRQAWSRFNTTRPFAYEVFTVQLNNTLDQLLFRDLRALVGFVAVLALFIAALGLLGMAAFTAVSRTKETGIRKVLGAGVWQTTALLSRELLLIVAVATGIALPLAWWINQFWLEQVFPHRIEPGFWMLMLNAAGLLLLAALAVVSQTVKTALVNPVESLRYE